MVVLPGSDSYLPNVVPQQSHIVRKCLYGNGSNLYHNPYKYII